MAPNVAKSNFKSYDGQARLLRAIVAAHPEVKWNYTDIGNYYGSDTTKFALEHRFRELKGHAEVIKDARSQGVDAVKIPAELPREKKEIAKLYGSSTPDGIQWQFRSIKKDANTLKASAKNGGDPTKALNFTPSSAASTPRGKSGSISMTTPSTKRSAASGSRSETPNKRQKTQALKKEFEYGDEGDGEDEDEEEFDHDQLDTPSKPRTAYTPINGSRRSGNQPTAGSAPSSIFGQPSRAAAPNKDGFVPSASQQSIDLTFDDEHVHTPSKKNASNAEIKPVVGHLDGVADDFDFISYNPLPMTADFQILDDHNHRHQQRQQPSPHQQHSYYMPEEDVTAPSANSFMSDEATDVRDVFADLDGEI